jgi:hypothetical protein
MSPDGDAVDGDFVCECEDLNCIAMALTTHPFAVLRASGRPVLADGTGKAHL